MRCQHGRDERLATETSALIPPSGTAREETKYPNGTSPRRFWAIFSLVLVIQFIGCFDTTITASSHPAITSYFGAAHLASWLSTSFLLTSTACQPFVGRLSDAVGRKPPFIVCLALFTAATAWCTVAGSIVSLILARALCGIGAGSLMTLGSIVTTDIIPIEKRGLYQPYTNIVYGGGCGLGAALGGVMAETLGWRWEFGVQVPFLLLCIGISSVVIPDGMGLRGPSKGAWNAIKEFDGRGSVLLATATTALILGLSLGGNTLPWSHPAVVALLAAFAVCIPTFLWVESRCANPVVPLNLLFKPPRSNLLFANFIAAMLTHSILFNMPLFYQAVLLTSASSSGLRLMVPSMVASVVSAVTGPSIAWSRRLKWPLVSGVTCYVCGTLCLCFLHRDVPSTLSIVALVPSAVGQGFLFPGTFIAMLATSEQSELAVATTTLLLWRSLGMVVGIAGSSVVVQNALLHYLDVFVQGGGKSRVISQVRASVEAVALLESPYREQAIHSYESALRVTFVGCAVMAAAVALVISPIKLPRLGAK